MAVWTHILAFPSSPGVSLISEKARGKGTADDKKDGSYLVTCSVTSFNDWQAKKHFLFPFLPQKMVPLTPTPSISTEHPQGSILPHRHSATAEVINITETISLWLHCPSDRLLRACRFPLMVIRSTHLLAHSLWGLLLWDHLPAYES